MIALSGVRSSLGSQSRARSVRVAAGRVASGPLATAAPSSGLAGSHGQPEIWLAASTPSAIPGSRRSIKMRAGAYGYAQCWTGMPSTNNFLTGSLTLATKQRPVRPCSR
jgi:hypothetical protein